LNLHGNNPASTSTQGGRGALGTEPTELLAAEAAALLEAAAGQQAAEPGRLVAFARAYLELTEEGRLALAVLDGGVFAPRRALELAAHVSAQAELGTTRAARKP
jgi:hypothetical protein